MQKYQKPKFTYKQLGNNPCVNSGFIVYVNTITFKDQYKKYSDGLLLPVSVEVEKTPYTKLYVDSLRRLVISGLTPSAKELYLWVMFEIEHGKDALWINRERFMLENNTSLNTYKKALDELLRYALLAFTVVKDVYWINPDFFFKGDRISKYPNNIIES
jgi:hypothetical protein